ncbi:hypothetical protein BC831DRAFT_259506 [Entophlyctis helioformis]|nr:hypothetical protein BC831DRAFT_259506 [Entophlyctis helioformis]
MSSSFGSAGSTGTTCSTNPVPAQATPQTMHLSSRGSVDDHQGQPDPSAMAFTQYDMYMQVCIFATLVSFMCAVCIILSSRHLYKKTLISKMPLASAFLWSLSSTFVTLATWTTGAPVGLSNPNVWLALGFDIASRSTLLWFAYFRTRTLWHNATFLAVLSAAIQLAQLAGAIYILWEQRPESLLMTTGDIRQFNIAIGAYSATDLLASVIDLILINRLWVLNRQARSTAGRPSELVKPRFFYYSLLCMTLVILLSVLMATLFATGNDPYFGFNTTLFAFRIQLTDIFSNLMRDSLIEARAGSRSSLGVLPLSSGSTGNVAGSASGDSKRCSSVDRLVDLLTCRSRSGTA